MLLFKQQKWLILRQSDVVALAEEGGQQPPLHAALGPPHSAAASDTPPCESPSAADTAAGQLVL